MTRRPGLAVLLVLLAGAPGLALQPPPVPTAPPAESTTEAPTAPRAPSAPRPRTTPSPTPVPAPAPEAPGATASDWWSESCLTRSREPRVRVLQDHAVARGEAADDVVTVFGNLTIEGEVCGDASVVFGDARLAKGAAVRGSLVVVGGTLEVEPDAAIHGELVLVGGALRAPDGFRAGRGHVIIGVPLLGDSVRGTVPYLTRGLGIGRLIVHDLPWVWAIVGITFFIYLVCNLLFPHATAATANAIAERPLSTFAAGALALVLTGPVLTLLAVTVIGLALIPVAGVMMVVGWIVGKIAVCRWIGSRLVGEDDSLDRLQATRSLLIGFAVLTIAYLIPVLALVVWGLTGVLGIGAVSIAFVRAFRRENPPVPPPSPVVPPVPPTAPAPAVEPPVSPYRASEPYVASAANVPLSSPTPHATYESAYVPPPLPPISGPADTRALLAFPRASFMERLGAFALDTAVVVITHQVLGLPGDNFLVLLLVAYHVAFWVSKQTTLGGMVCNLRVARVDGGPLRFVDALVRGVTAIFSLAIFGIGALWILRDPERQSWHDKVAGTVVVRVPGNFPLA